MACDMTTMNELSEKTKRGMFFKIGTSQREFLHWLIYTEWPPLEHVELNKVLDTEYYNGIQKGELNELRTKYLDKYLTYKYTR